MANLLTITKKPHGFYDFVVNENLADIVTNDMNRFMGVGDFCHFKTVSGANVIKEQNITFGNITLIDGVPLATASSMNDLINKLDLIGFFDWRDIGGGTGGVDRYEELIDTEPFFGNDGKVPIVDEAEMKLKYTSLPDVSYLEKFPTPLVSGKMLIVKSDASGYEFVEAINVVTQEIRSGYTLTTTSEDKLSQALALKANLTDIPTIPENFPKGIEYTAIGGETFFEIETAVSATMMYYNGVPQSGTMWDQLGNTITLNFDNPLISGDFMQFS